MPSMVLLWWPRSCAEGVRLLTAIRCTTGGHWRSLRYTVGSRRKKLMEMDALHISGLQQVYALRMTLFSLAPGRTQFFGCGVSVRVCFQPFRLDIGHHENGAVDSTCATAMLISKLMCSAHLKGWRHTSDFDARLRQLGHKICGVDAGYQLAIYFCNKFVL